MSNAPATATLADLELDHAFASFGTVSAHLRDPGSTGRIARLRATGRIDSYLYAEAVENPAPTYVGSDRPNLTLAVVYAYVREAGARGPVADWVAR